MDRPAYVDIDPVPLKFGTSGLRGLVQDMTDLEVYVNVQGFLRFLAATEGTRAVAVARDLRDACPKTGIESSPRIARAVVRAVTDFGGEVVNLGQLPTPALADFARRHGMAGIMVTGSHIPADRNGVKFYKAAGEVLKTDEAAIFEHVAAARAEIYGRSEAPFGRDGQLPAGELPVQDARARAEYLGRYLEPFAGDRPLAGQKIVVFQHSSVARDVLMEILAGLGAEAIAEGRTERFVPVDTEDVMPDHEAKYREMVTRHGAHALVSTDGDGDRPLVVDEQGRFHRGDAVGIVTAQYVGARRAAVPVSGYDAIDRAFADDGVTIERTRIGSPWVIAAMQAAEHAGADRVVGWEANGGFLLQTEAPFGRGALSALPTRDAALPILAPLLTAAARGQPVSAVFAALPQRATRAGLLDEFAPERSQALLQHVLPPEPVTEVTVTPDAVEVRAAGGAAPASDPAPYRAIATVFETYFPPVEGFGAVTRVNFMDGVRAWFANGDIVHLRPSGNAPQFRIYAVADTQARADEIVDRAIAEPDGTLRRMERDLIGD